MAANTAQSCKCQPHQNLVVNFISAFPPNLYGASEQLFAVVLGHQFELAGPTVYRNRGIKDFFIPI